MTLFAMPSFSVLGHASGTGGDADSLLFLGLMVLGLILLIMFRLRR